MFDTEKSIARRCICSIVRQFDYKTKEMDGKALKELVGTVRRTDGIISPCIDILFEYLRQLDCDVRLCILHISGYFFQRSHNFRLDLIDVIQDFLVYTLETDPIHYPLPGPSEASCLLKKETITMLRCWIDKFGLGYQKLRTLGNYLSKSKSLDWENSNCSLQIERDLAANEAFKREVYARKVVEKIAKLFDESRAEIERIQIEAFQLSELLLPHFCSLNSDGDAILQRNEALSTNIFGAPILSSTDVTVFLRADVEIEKSAENIDLINQLKDTTKQLEKWNSKINTWIKKLTQVGSDTHNTPMTSITKRLIDTKRALGEELQKCKEFQVKEKVDGNHADANSSDSEDEEFLDVEEKEGYESELLQLNSIEDERKNDASFICSTVPGPSNIRHEQNKSFNKSSQYQQTDFIQRSKYEKNNLNKPRRLAMDSDLCYWGEESGRPEVQKIYNQVAEDCWWRKCSENDNDNINASDDYVKSYVPRQMTFVGEMSTFQKMCRAPLPSGKLCPRMEYDRCALHGAIIERDEQGFPMEEQFDNKNSDANSKKVDKEKADEIAYIRDIEAATGMQLSGTSLKSSVSNKCKKTVRKRTKSEGFYGRERLKTKLFDKRALKRVSDTLIQIQRTKAERNFIHQFNYAITRR